MPAGAEMLLVLGLGAMIAGKLEIEIRGDGNASVTFTRKGIMGQENQDFLRLDLDADSLADKKPAEPDINPWQRSSRPPEQPPPRIHACIYINTTSIQNEIQSCSH